jgi:H+/Cl- antiporter ClcA
LLSAGGAAGVAAGFNAPIAGVFFALEIMQNAFQSVDMQREEADLKNGVVAASSSSTNALMTTNTSITPILIAAVLSAIVSQSILGNHLIFRFSQGLSIQESPLLELPIYLLLGVMSGTVAFVFSYTAKVSRSFFAGEWGAEPVRGVMSSLPDPLKPAVGGLLCGLVGLVYPQILFFGYETLNPLLKTQAYLPITLILSLLGLKTLMTAVSAGSGLVGGTFAPSLFLGCMTGAVFRNGAAQLIRTLNELDGASYPIVSYMSHALPLQDLQLMPVGVYAMVGAGSVLAAVSNKQCIEPRSETTCKR